MPQKNKLLQYHRTTRVFLVSRSNETNICFFLCFPSLRFLLLFIILGLIILPLLALRKTLEIIETKLADGLYMRTRMRKLQAARRCDDVRQWITKTRVCSCWNEAPFLLSFAVEARKKKPRLGVPHVKSSRAWLYNRVPLALQDRLSETADSFSPPTVLRASNGA